MATADRNRRRAARELLTADSMSASAIKRVVVRGTNWVGDSVMTVPALRALRRLLPDAKITLATRPFAKGIFSEVDFIDDVLVYDRRNAFSVVSQVREWRRREFDLAVLFQNAFEAALIPFLAGVPTRLGYATESRQGLLTHPRPLPDWRSSKHEVFYYLYLITALEQSLSGTSTVCESDPQCLGGVDDVAEEDELAGSSVTHDSREAHRRAHVGHDPKRVSMRPTCALSPKIRKSHANASCSPAP